MSETQDSPKQSGSSHSWGVGLEGAETASNWGRLKGRGQDGARALCQSREESFEYFIKDNMLEMHRRTRWST